jgi:hypothetical protein
MYIWSHSGIDHANEAKKRLGLIGKIVGKKSFKPEIALDDKEHDLGLVNLPV